MVAVIEMASNVAPRFPSFCFLVFFSFNGDTQSFSFLIQEVLSQRSLMNFPNYIAKVVPAVGYSLI